VRSRNSVSNALRTLADNIEVGRQVRPHDDGGRRPTSSTVGRVDGDKAVRTRTQSSRAVNRHPTDHAAATICRWRSGGDRIHSFRGRHVGEHLHIVTAQASWPTAIIKLHHRRDVSRRRRATAELRINHSYTLRRRH